MEGLKYFIPFTCAICCWPIAKYAGIKFDIIDYPDNRKIHSTPTLKTGGILILLGYIIGIFVSKIFFWPLLVCFLFVFAIGILGDKDVLPPYSRLIMQFLISLIFILTTKALIIDLYFFRIPQWLQIPFTMFCIVGVTNAYNLVDGMNGLSSGLGIISLIIIGILGHIYNATDIFMLTIIMSSAIAGFWILNIRGKIFMGDGGSYLIGFAVASLSVLLAVNIPKISPYAFLLNVIIPVFDTIFAIYRRKRLKKGAFNADRRHLHHIFIRRYGSKTKSLIVILLFQIIFSSIAIMFHSSSLLLIFVIIISIVFLRRIWFKKITIKYFSL